eukprot:TRINITY_DN1767_c0_g1_i1.p1 TRINITY_DN1767_c0_g1~~TRINITY_DN1767_c0_g1_i1.p1  ORF type:complete len:358 (+),score=-18.54 TRINITY_DN1767_c0_g1_i1:183-1256(+)
MLSSLRHCGRLRVLPLALENSSLTVPERPHAPGKAIISLLRRGLRYTSAHSKTLSSNKWISHHPRLQVISSGNESSAVATEGKSALCTQVRHMSAMTKPTLEHRSDFFKATKQVNEDHVLIVLNYSLPSFVPLLWEQSRLRICADGGANRVYDELPRIFQGDDQSAIRARYIPDAIIGDLDSLRPDVRNFYSQNNVPIIDLSHDQDTTDLHKCINYAQSANPCLTQQSKLLVVGAVGGRLDHQLSNIHILYKFRDMRIVLLGKGNLALLLPEGFEHEIYPDRSIEGPICALIPVGSPVSDVHTTGLRWNLGGQSLQFGELISTSNEMKDERISVRAKGPLLWTTELTGTPGFQNSSA